MLMSLGNHGKLTSLASNSFGKNLLRRLPRSFLAPLVEVQVKIDFSIQCHQMQMQCLKLLEPPSNHCEESLWGQREWQQREERSWFLDESTEPLTIYGIWGQPNLLHKQNLWSSGVWTLPLISSSINPINSGLLTLKWNSNWQMPLKYKRPSKSKALFLNMN